MIDIEFTIGLILEFVKAKHIAIYFTFGSLATFGFILYADKLIQSVPKKERIQLDANNQDNEIERGIQSLDQAFRDKIINQEEYEKFKSDLINKQDQ